MKLPVDYDELSAIERRQVRLEYIERQKGLCYHCKTSLEHGPAEYVRNVQVDRKLFPPSFFKWPVHLHHDHNTGMTIGAVHCYCNAVLWQYHGE